MGKVFLFFLFTPMFPIPLANGPADRPDSLHGKRWMSQSKSQSKSQSQRVEIRWAAGVPLLFSGVPFTL